MADDDSGSFGQVTETFQIIGSIPDVSVVDLDKQGLYRLGESVCIFVYSYHVTHLCT